MPGTRQSREPIDPEATYTLASRDCMLLDDGDGRIVSFEEEP